MECNDCKKQYDFTKCTRVLCQHAYCIKCLVKKLYNYTELTPTIIKCSLKCCNTEDNNIIFGKESLIDEEYKKWTK